MPKKTLCYKTEAKLTNSSFPNVVLMMHQIIDMELIKFSHEFPPSLPGELKFYHLVS